MTSRALKLIMWMVLFTFHCLVFGQENEKAFRLKPKPTNRRFTFGIGVGVANNSLDMNKRFMPDNQPIQPAYILLGIISMKHSNRLYSELLLSTNSLSVCSFNLKRDSSTYDINLKYNLHFSFAYRLKYLFSPKGWNIGLGYDIRNENHVWTTEGYNPKLNSGLRFLAEGKQFISVSNNLSISIGKEIYQKHTSSEFRLTYTHHLGYFDSPEGDPFFSYQSQLSYNSYLRYNSLSLCFIVRI